MARIRSVKPSFWEDELTGELDFPVQVLYIALWNIADDAGLLEGDARRIRAFAFRYKPKVRVDHVQGWLRVLEERERLIGYEVGGRRYFVIAKFHTHQRPERPHPSDLPRPPLSVLGRLDDINKSKVIARSAERKNGGLSSETALSLTEASPNEQRAVTEPSASAQRGIGLDRTGLDRTGEERNRKGEDARTRAGRDRQPPTKLVLDEPLAGEARAQRLTAVAGTLLAIADDRWRKALEDIACRMTSAASFETWFTSTTLEERDGFAIVRAPNDFAREWIETKYRKQIAQVLGVRVSRVICALDGQAVQLEPDVVDPDAQVASA